MRIRSSNAEVLRRLAISLLPCLRHLPAEVISLTALLLRHEAPIHRLLLQARGKFMAYRYQ